MTDEGEATAAVGTTTRPLWQRILKWLAFALIGLVVLVLAIVLGINTDPGRRFVADKLGGYTTASGLNIKVGRIDGSLYGHMILSDVRVADPTGVFLTAPRLDVDWRPFAYAQNHIDVRSLDAALVTLARSPALKATPSDPNAPLLPDLDIDINRLRIARFVIGAPVTGQVHVLSLDGGAHIADRRAQLTAAAVALKGPGVAGGDRLALKLDAVPDANRLDLDAKLTAPVGGVVAGLTGLKAPLAVSVGGKGTWAGWQGRAIATLGGGQLANLAVASRSGHIEVRGTTKPGLYLQGPVERLTSPEMAVAIDTTLDQRRADTRIKLSSSALAVDAGGLIDLARNRFGNFAVDARLLTPGAIAPALAGRDVAARVVLDGAFATPTVDYKIRAAALGFSGTTVEDLYAEGLARVDAKRILVPVKARARRVTGLNAAAGGLLNNLTVNGDFAIQGVNVLSDNLHVRSSNIDATAIVVANLSTGRYTGALKGRINDYRVDGIGIVNLTTDANLVTTPAGFGIKGRVVATTARIFNDGARSFLGGDAVMRADVGYAPNGLITFSNLRMNAPQFRVTRGEGRYAPNGQLLVSADAYSTQYGPLTARVSGTVNDPVVLLEAAHPGVGVGLVGLKARIVGRGGAYAVLASGGTQYGPFTADVLVRPGRELAVDIHRVVFAGIVATGRVVQTVAGPFAGQLQFAGSGLNGQVALGAQGKYQRAVVNARADNAKIPGPVDFTIGRAIVNATAVLYPTAPQVVADVQVGDLRYGATVLSAARAKVNYVGGHGTAQALLTGSNGVPFRLAANAQLSPSDYLVALQGQANGIAFHTGNPARIHATKGVYALAPTQIAFGQGSTGGALRLAGRYGAGLALQARLDRLDLSIANALIPNLGIAGQATGSLDLTQPNSSAIPNADARLTIANFQRTGLAAVSEPVDIVFAGKLLPDGGEARAIVKRGGTPVGRMVATLRPLPPSAGSWSTRLMAAPLSGGIRYNGPSAVLFSLAALPNQQVSGPIAIAADFGGTVTAPRINGLIRADNLTYDNETYGTRLSQMKIAGRFNNDRLELTSLSARAGDGTVQAQGSVGLAADSGYPIDLRATLDKAQLAKSDALGATASGTVHLTNGKDGGLIQGDITVPNARYEIIRQGAAEVPELTGVRRKSDMVPGRPTDRPKPAPTGLFKLDLHVRAANQLFVSGMGLESEWSMNLRIGGTSAAPVITGGLDLVRGTYSFSGKRFDVTKGEIRFRGGALTDPDINIVASTTTSDITVTINITGTGEHPQIAFTSTPTLPQDEVLSRLLFGTSPTNLSATEAIQLAAALNSLRGSSGGGLNPLGKLRSATGFDRLRILGADQATGRGTSLAAGKYISKNIYVEIITDARGFTATQLQVSLSRVLSVLSSTGSFGGSNVSVKYSRDFR
ncbi:MULTISPECIES: translocation/assembly module TamB domain-containing protein [unclassified Sphingomonas]|uniref:translocation/assembly module TamB domain-containing protein n=1 Tax=unclassified Sphingomonas TaxID=196159 RepID=UPI00226AC304|nr:MULTISPECIES: translocation/assembly module TamB domain-containing protein [unclassified Sphingomonas]